MPRKTEKAQAAKAAEDKRDDKGAVMTSAKAYREAKLRELTFSLVSVCFAMLLLAAASLAWFSSNKDVGSGGAAMQTDVSPNLIISDSTARTEGGIGYPSILGTADPYQVDLDFDPLLTLRSATHDWSVGTATGLKYCSNPTKVSRSTGLQSGDDALTFAAVPLDGTEPGKTYYVDFTVYIASAGKAMDVDHLYATFTGATLDSSPLEDYQNAASVDFYVGSVSSGNYKGTLNLAGNGTDGTNTGLTQIDLTGSATIPLNTALSNNYITVVMRFYFDGALLKTGSQTYIRSENVDLDDFTMYVHFEAIESAA